MSHYKWKGKLCTKLCLVGVYCSAFTVNKTSSNKTCLLTCDIVLLEQVCLRECKIVSMENMTTLMGIPKFEDTYVSLFCSLAQEINLFLIQWLFPCSQEHSAQVFTHILFPFYIKLFINKFVGAGLKAVQHIN